jgi:hypothetical protein
VCARHEHVAIGLSKWNAANDAAIDRASFACSAGGSAGDRSGGSACDDSVGFADHSARFVDADRASDGSRAGVGGAGDDVIGAGDVVVCPGSGVNEGDAGTVGPGNGVIVPGAVVEGSLSGPTTPSTLPGSTTTNQPVTGTSPCPLGTQPDTTFR